MKGQTWIVVFVVLLCLSVSAEAARVSSSSSYGLPAGAECTGTLVCTADISTDALTLAADIVPEVYLASSYGGTAYDVPDSPFVIFDFTVTNFTAGDSLVLTASGAPIAADSNGSLAWGVFECPSVGTGANCGPAPTDPTYCDSGCISGNTLTLPLFGAAPVYYVILDDSSLCGSDGSRCVSSTDPTLTVSAQIQAPSTGAVPEPRLWPLLAIAMLAGIVLYRRRLAATSR